MNKNNIINYYNEFLAEIPFLEYYKEQDTAVESHILSQKSASANDPQIHVLPDVYVQSLSLLL